MSFVQKGENADDSGWFGQTFEALKQKRPSLTDINCCKPTATLNISELPFAKYDAKLGLQNQPESAQLAIRILFALVPAIFLLICVPLLIKYPITKQSHAEVLKQLEERRKQQK